MSKDSVDNIADLKFDPKNARVRTERSSRVIRTSLEKFGGMRSIVLDENNVIRAGNGTVEEAGQLGIEKVRVIDADGDEIIAVRRKGLTEAEWKEYAVADNRSSDLSEWDAEVLAELSEEIDLSGLFFEDELAELLNAEDVQVDDEPVGEDDEEALAEQLERADSGEIESRVSLGQIWKLGRHYICAGDSTDEGNVRKLLGDQFGDVGMVCADPPYGMKLEAEYKWSKSNEAMGIKPSKGYSRVIGDEKDFDPTPLLAIFSKVKEQYWWGADYYIDKLPDFGKRGSFIVWDKKNDDLQKVWTNEFELCWSKEKHKKIVIRILWNGALGTESEDVKTRVHPTQKPVRVYERIFQEHSKPNDIIFDPFLGSAPSIIAAQQMEGSRAVYGFELSPAYCAVILNRFEAFTGVNAELVGSL